MRGGTSLGGVSRRPIEDNKIKGLRCPLYLHELIFVRWKRLCLGSGGRPTRGVAKSPDTPPATTVDEHGTFVIVTHDRIVA